MYVACVCVSDDGCEELKFARLMDSHVCYDLIPYTSKLVVFDTQLTVTHMHTPAIVYQRYCCI